MPQLRLERGGVAGDAGKLKPGPGRSAQEVATHQLGRIHAAMIELVAERGYDAVTLRELTQRAGVSSRSFYKHYAGKEECLLAVHRWVGSRTLRGLSESPPEANDPLDGLRLAMTRIVFDWGATPSGAHLLLVAPYHAGKQARDQLRQTEAIFRTHLERSISDGKPESAASALAAQAIFDGLVAVGSSGLLEDGGVDLADKASRLAEWACGLANPVVGRLENFSEGWREGRDSPAAPVSDHPGVEMAGLSNSNATLLLSAVTKLLARDSAKTPTPDEIAAVAGLPLTAFNANFPDVESCAAAALDVKLETVMQSVRRSVHRNGAPAGSGYRVANSFISCIASDSALRSFCCADAVAAMISARLRLYDRLAVWLRDSAVEAKFGWRAAELRAHASAGALWSLLRHHLSEHPNGASENLTAQLISPILAPVADGCEAIMFMEQEQTFSAA